MAHYEVETDPHYKSTPKEWLEVGGQIGRLVNTWSGRMDLLAKVGPEHGGSTAYFTREDLEVHINSNMAFGELTKPSEVKDLTKRPNQYRHIKASGMILHEAMHAKYTRWAWLEISERPDMNPAIFRAFKMLEEPRIEMLGARLYPMNRGFLRSSASQILLEDMSDERVAKLSATRQAAHMACLTLGRADAGVLPAADVEDMRVVVTATLGAPLLHELRKIWQAFLKLTNCATQVDEAVRLATRWVELVDEKAEEEGEGEDQTIIIVMDGDGDGDGEGEGEGGDGDGEVSEITKALQEALGQTAQLIFVHAAGQLINQENKEIDEAKRVERDVKVAERTENSQAGKRLFGHGFDPSQRQTRSRLEEKRKPTQEERRAATQVADELQRARYRDRIRVETESEMPPGRLKVGRAMQGDAMRSMGLMPTVKPFESVKHRYVEDPDLKMLWLSDISGSMDDAMEPMGVAAWVFSEAAKLISAELASVYFGADIFPTLEPGQHLDTVNIYSAADGAHHFNEAFRAGDGVLDLLNSRGARLLVVVSDGVYEAEQIKATEHWLKRCKEEGVAVLWIGEGNSAQGMRMTEAAGGTFIKTRGDITGAALEIGKAAARALETASAGQ